MNLPAVVETLTGRGWRYSAEQIQFRNTALLDLHPPEDDLLAAMKSKTRYNTRLAARRGVTVRAGSVKDIPRFYEMYAETGVRDGFAIREYPYYRDAWQTFRPLGERSWGSQSCRQQHLLSFLVWRAQNSSSK